MRWCKSMLALLAAFLAVFSASAQTPGYSNIGRAPTDEGTQLAPRLVGGQGTISTLQPVRTIGSYWPFATTIWDYINRAMPRNQGIASDEIYSLTAFILNTSSATGSFRRPM